ncbi:polysaccharide pyruvyl transferase family protein [Enterobacter hormaechei]|uniref:polysaccharide pyruvyl transferase family protein n=1 Tax=Enterobacter hormaechei TaxID=158836 RepID=UPI00320F8438
MGKYTEAFFALSTEFKDRLLAIGKDKVPVNYYTRHNNWGDQLNKYLIEKITKKTVVKNNFKQSPHILAIGSVLSSASSKSIIWGSGFISKDAPLKTKDLDIRSVRGVLTRNRLRNEFGINCPDVLGDPAVLLPLFYDAKHMTKKYKVGVIPHYKDKELPAVQSLLKNGCVLVDIQNDIEPFIDKMNECEFIISSSLHGLIAADTYGIPNLWVAFSDKVLGGEYKFCDYYSTTDNNAPKVCIVSGAGNYSLEDLLAKCRCNQFTRSKEDLLKAFPTEYR